MVDMTDEPSPPNPNLADDEPPPDRRAAATSDPAALAELRSLAAVRDLVAGLSRPAAPDLREAVLGRIAARRRRRPRTRAAVAATLLAGCLAAFAVGRGRAPRPVAAPPPSPATVVAAVAPAAPAVVEPAAPTPTRAPVVARRFVGPPDERPALVRRLMERAGPVHVFLAADSRTIDAAGAAALVRLSSRRDFHRFDLPAEDDRPAAAVFVAVLDPAELRTLRMRLADALPGGVREREADPLLLADLARAETATTLRGAPAAELLVPRRELAIRSPVLDAPPEAEPAPAPPDVPAPAEAADDPATVLVWIPDGD